MVTACGHGSELQGGAFGGKGISPAIAVTETQRASREIANILLMIGDSVRK